MNRLAHPPCEISDHTGGLIPSGNTVAASAPIPIQRNCDLIFEWVSEGNQMVRMEKFFL
jgi:hypothetical protein